MSILFINYI